MERVLIDKVASSLFVFVLHAEELHDHLAEGVLPQCSLKRLVAAAVQPRHRRFAVRPEQRDDRQSRLAFLSGEVRGVESLGLPNSGPTRSVYARRHSASAYRSRISTIISI